MRTETKLLTAAAIVFGMVGTASAQSTQSQSTTQGSYQSERRSESSVVDGDQDIESESSAQIERQEHSTTQVESPRGQLGDRPVFDSEKDAEAGASSGIEATSDVGVEAQKSDQHYREESSSSHRMEQSVETE